MTDRDYYRLIFEYGILSVLLVLDYLTDIENYEECSKIESAIRQCELITKTKIKRVIDADLINETTKELTGKGLTGDGIYGKYLIYAEDILNKLGYSQIVFKEIILEDA